MTREEIHKLPWKAQEYINKLERKLTLTDDGCSTEFKVWDDLFGILAWKFIPTKSGDMMIDAEEVYNELKDKFELKINKNDKK
tara:strand:+ start:41 stop:289 length:249 start_codon:yes stop_codon:yes gene_type:complete